MLRITRRVGERVVIGGETVVEVLEVRGHTVRLGIQAPRSVPVYREEIWIETQPLPALAGSPDAEPTGSD